MLFEIIIIVLFLIVGVGAGIFFVQNAKAHFLIIRDSRGDKAFTTNWRMVEKKDKDTGVVFWKSVIWQPKFTIPAPSTAVCDVGTKGRRFAEAYKITEDEFLWIKDKGIKVNYDKSGKPEVLEAMDDGEYIPVDTFKPFTTTQRETLIYQRKKADEISKKGWSTGEIAGMVSVGALVMVIVAILIFGGDLLNEYKTARSSAESFNREHKAFMQEQAKLLHSTALLLERVGIDTSDIKVETTQQPQGTGTRGSVTIQSGGSEDKPLTDTALDMLE